MAEGYGGLDRREFFRYEYDSPLSFSIVKSTKDKSFPRQFVDAMSKNLSASGLLFIAKGKDLPNLSSFLIVDLDYHTAAVCKEIETRAMLVDNKLLGRVVRIEDNEDGTFGIGVAFVKKDEGKIEKTA